MRTVQDTPDRIVAEDRSIRFGMFRAPFRDANLLDAPLYAFPVPRCWKRFRLKERQHFGVITPTHYLGTVIFDAKLAGLSFFYVYDRTRGVRIEHARRKLVFTPAGERVERTTAALGLVRSDFRQPFGTFRGSFRDDLGVVHPIDDLFGLAEHHVTRY